MTVGAEAPRPQLLWEYGSVVVQTEGEVVLDEIFARDSQIEGIPETELVLHPLEKLTWDSAVLWDRLAQKNSVPDLLNRQIAVSSLHSACVPAMQPYRVAMHGVCPGVLLTNGDARCRAAVQIRTAKQITYHTAATLQ